MDVKSKRQLKLSRIIQHAPDACAMLVDFITGGVKVVTVAKRPF